MMKKIFFFILTVLLAQYSIGQTETFDIITYTPPKDFKKTSKQGVVIYTHQNSTGGFCIIAIYASAASAGNEKKDFTNAWNDLVVTPYKGDTNPKTETQTNADGWKVVAAAAPVKLESIDAYTILSVFSGFGKKISVLSTLNDQSYTKTIDSLLENIKLDKTANAAVTPSTIQLTTNANETNSQFGSVKYATPKGWNATRYPDGDIITPVDIPKGEFLEIWVQQSMNFSGTIEQALQKSFDETAASMSATKMSDVNGGNYSKEAAKISFHGWEYIRCTGGIHMGGGDYPPEYGLDLFVIKLNNRFERIAIIKSRKNCDYSTYYPSSRAQYADDIENFLFSLQFADWKEPVIKIGTAKGNGLAGAWQGISMVVGAPKTGAELGAELKVRQLIFFSNGQAYFGKNFPLEGLYGLNTWIKAELNRRDWGTYSFANGQGVLKLPYAEIPLRIENGKLIITTSKTDHAFMKINAVDGAKFNGVYAFSSRDYAGQETGNTPVISFTADGKFADNGVVKILCHEYISCINPGLIPGSGAYEVKDHTVLFNYRDGRKVKIAFIGADYDIRNQSPATLTLSFNEDILRKQ